MSYKVIGVSGVAGSGKDLFFSLLQKRIPNLIRFALADALKAELASFIYNSYGIDVFKCDRQEKALIRPILVAHGKIKRQRSNGTHWTNILEKSIANFLISNKDAIICVTDIRYDVFKKDEVSWLKDDMKGILVHLSLYEDIDGKRLYLLPPNDDEAENDPKLIAKADCNIEWPKIYSTPSDSPDLNKLTPYVEKFMSKFRENG